MKKAILAISAMALMVAASCQKEGAASTEGGLTLTATVEQQNEDSRTTLDGTTVKWAATDQISVLDAAGKKVKLQATGSGTSVKFTEVAGTRESGFDEKSLLYAVYPADGNISLSGGKLTIALPEEQSYAENSFGPGANIAVAQIIGNNMAFKNVLGMLKLVFTAKTDTKLTSIVLSGNKDEILSGSMEVTPGDVPSATCTGNKTVTLDLGEEGVTVGAEAKAFYIAAPVGAFGGSSETDGGFKAELYNGATKVDEVLTTNGKTNVIVRSAVRAMPSKEIGGSPVPGPLPEGYIELEYVSSAANAWINTGYIISSDDCHCEFAFKFTEEIASTNIVSSGNRADKKHNTIYSAGTQPGMACLHLYVGTGTPLSFYDALLGEVNTVILDIHDSKVSFWYNNDQLLDKRTSNGTCVNGEEPIVFFSGYQNGGYTARAKKGMHMYYFKYTDNGVLVRDMIPCKHPTTTPGEYEYGMWDKVEGKFYGSAGTGKLSGKDKD